MFIDSSRQKARVKRGGTKKICYIDGWVEFLDKKLAKRVALTLNGTPVGGGKRSFHAEFTWNIRYLSKFKWNHLTEHKSMYLGDWGMYQRNNCDVIRETRPDKTG